MTPKRKRPKPLPGSGVKVDLDPPGENAKMFSVVGVLEVRGMGDDHKEVADRLSHALNHPKVVPVLKACGLVGVGFKPEKWAELDPATQRVKRGKPKAQILSPHTGKPVGGH